MTIRVPFTVESPIRDAFLDVEQRLRELEARGDSTEDLELQIQALRDELALLNTRRSSPNPRDIMVASGPMHQPGLVPDPPSSAGTTKYLREDGTWSTIAPGGSSVLTTKGDIWGYSSADARIPVGSNDTVLKADSGQALGVIWEKVAASETTFAATSQVNADDVQEAIDELATTPGLVNIKYVAPGTGNIATALAAGSTGDIFILGAGTYTETTIDVPDALTEFAIIGQGPGSTTVNITGGGIGINAADVRRNKAIIQGFTMQPTTQSATWGIKVWGRSQNSYVNPHIVIRNVTIQRSSTPYWFTAGGFWLENCFEAVVENCSFRNKPSDYVGVGILLESCVVCNVLSFRATEVESAFKTDRCSDYTRVENAVSDGHSTHHGCEGSRFIGCEAYIAKWGWYVGTRTLDCMFIDGTLAACTDNGVTDGGATILGLEGYNTIRGTWVDGMTGAGAAGVAAKMQGWKILGNTFNGPNDTSVNSSGVAFTADTADRAQVIGNNVRLHDYGVYNNGADSCLFTNNVFESMTANDTGIYILAGGDSNICYPNQYYNSPGYTDGGTSNLFAPSGSTPAAHAVESAGGFHTASGLTTGHVLKATGATTFAFGALAAGSVANTAAGNIVATDVQAALNELDTEKVAKAGDTMTGNLSLTSASSYYPQVFISNTNADSSAGYVILDKNSASPADNDFVGTVLFQGKNDAGSPETISYATIQAKSTDITDGTEDGIIELRTMNGGTGTTVLTVAGTGVSITGTTSISDNVIPSSTETGKPAVGITDSANGNYTLDPALYGKRMRRYDVNAAGATGLTQLNGGGTPTGTIVQAGGGTAGTEFSQVCHYYQQTTTSDNNAVNLYVDPQEWDMGDVNGGFHFVMRIGWSSTNPLKSDGKLLVGMSNSVSAFTGTTEPSANTNFCGLGKDEADTNLHFMHNDGAGAATKVDTGLAYNGMTQNVWYEFSMYVPDGGGAVYFKLKLVNGNTVVSSATATTNLPATGQVYTPRLFIANGGGGTAMRQDYGFIHIEARL